VAADRAEVPVGAEQERAVAAHRDPADRDAPVLRHDLVEHHRSPPAVGAVVPVAVVAAVGQQDDRRAPPEVVQRVEERLAEHSRGTAAAAMEKDERPVAVLCGYDADLVQVAMDEAAVQRVVLDSSAASRPVAADQVADDDVGGDRQEDHHG
jgi:hypothetical protein